MLNIKFSTTANPMLNHALHYASLGIPVFPIHGITDHNGTLRCTCRGWKNCDKLMGKHPTTWHGSKDATTNESKIIWWWTKHPESNIGIATGETSGIFVLDVDGISGEHSLENLCLEYEDRMGSAFDAGSETLQARTGRGRHFFYLYPEFRIGGSNSGIRKDLDIKADGNYVVAPPSRHKSGVMYEWIGIEIPILSAPDWLIQEILKSSASNIPFGNGRGGHLPSERFRSSIYEGERTSRLFQYGCGLVRNHSPADVRSRLTALNAKYCVPPIDNEALEKIIKSAEKYRNLTNTAAFEIERLRSKSSK